MKFKQIKNAISLLDSGTLDEKTDNALIEKIFTSLNTRNLSTNDMLDTLDIMISNGDNPMKLSDYPRAQKAIGQYIKLHNPIVDFGINRRGERIMKQFVFFKDPKNQQPIIDTPEIGVLSSNPSCNYFNEIDKHREDITATLDRIAPLNLRF